jgi:hypothetical protein
MLRQEIETNDYLRIAGPEVALKINPRLLSR